MKQIQFSFADPGMLDDTLLAIRKYYDDHSFSGMVLHLYTSSTEKTVIVNICDQIGKVLPEAEYFGCSTNGNILNGDFSRETFALICTFLEYETTKIKILQYPLTEETEGEVSRSLVKSVEELPWVKAVEFLLTIRGMSLTGFCEGLSEVREGVQIFGGGAFGEDINEDAACVFSKAGGFLERGVVFVLLGGEDLSVTSTHVCGWKPLGSFLDVTAAEGAVLKELNGKSAYETYYKYLRIQNDENFFFHTLEFPFLYRDKGLDIMRAPVSCTPEGYLVMTSDMRQGSRARLSYGDPWTILETTKEKARSLIEFSPECIHVFSCAGRRTFWGNEDVGSETEAYQKVAPTSGFYTSSEFLRQNGYVIQHNVTQVIVGFREGTPRETDKSASCLQTRDFDGKVAMINRMAAFINVTMEELEDANKKLSLMAITDGLTGLLNRKEIQHRISETIEERMIEERMGEDTYLIMMDLDNFKIVNDRYGHKEGDNVLIRLAGLMREVMVDLEENCFCGRWGGEEFMILVFSHEEEEVLQHAERIRKIMEGIRFKEAGRVTISMGVVRVHPGETPDHACSRVDEALYEAKNSGKNRIIYHDADGK